MLQVGGTGLQVRPLESNARTRALDYTNRRIHLSKDHLARSRRARAAEPAATTASAALPLEDEAPDGVWRQPKEIIPLETLLADPVEAEQDPAQLLLVQNHCALKGWVEQPSPCCAAASVAGAFNALLRMDGEHERAVTPERVLGLLQRLIETELVEKRATVARALNMPVRGVAPLELLLLSLQLYQSRKGRPLTGRKQAAVGVKELAAGLRAVAASGPDPEARAMLGPIDEKDEATLWQRLRFGAAPPAPVAAAPVAAAPVVGAPVAAAPAPPPTSVEVVAADAPAVSITDEVASPKPTKRSAARPVAASPAASTSAGQAASPAAPVGSPLREEAALVKLAQAHAGWCKITAGSPSTSAVGNSHILHTVSTLSREMSLPIVAKRFCGLRESGEVEIVVNEHDTPVDMEHQWRRLRIAFEDPCTILLMHFWNHYAMIYAVREWRHAATGQLHLEVLTAKPAQRPCRWLPWAELHKWLVQWQGYTVFRLQLHDTPPPPYSGPFADTNAAAAPPAHARLDGVGSTTAAPPPPGVGRRTMRMAERHAERTLAFDRRVEIGDARPYAV